MKIFCYDLETTGTNPAQHSIHQIAAIIIIDGEEKERIEIKMRPNPKAKIDPEALKSANVTEEQIMQYQPFEDGYKALISVLSKYVSKYDKKDKFFTMGYNNASFDDNFMRGLFLQNGDVYYGSWFWADCVDVRVLAARQLMAVRHEMENFKLATVAKRLGMEIDDTKLHDALYDVDITYEVFNRLRLSKPELMDEIQRFTDRQNIQIALEQLELYKALPESQRFSREGEEHIHRIEIILKHETKTP